MRLSIQKLDWFIALPLLASFVMIGEIDMPRDSAVELSFWIKGAALAVITLVISVAVAAGSAIDRRCSEEYLFQLMANAALVAFATTMLVNLVWVIGEKAFDLPELASDNIVGVTTMAWALSYYWFRIRGMAQ